MLIKKQQLRFKIRQKICIITHHVTELMDSRNILHFASRDSNINIIVLIVNYMDNKDMTC